jgi:hypothetical protein
MPHALRRLVPFASAALLLAAVPAAAQVYAPPARSPIGGSLRLGVDTPSGSLYSGERLRDQFGDQLGVTGELGVRVTPQLLLGGYLGASFGKPGPRFDDVCVGGHCGAWSGRIGLLAQFEFAPWSTVSPWVGYGVGFAASGASGDAPGARFDYSYAGIDLGRLQAGLDFRPSRSVGIGLFAEWTFGVYRAYRWSEQGVTVADGTLPEQTVHQWFTFGPRISF